MLLYNVIFNLEQPGCLFNEYLIVIWGQLWRSGTDCDCKSIGCRYDPHLRRWNISLWCRGKARRWVLPLNTQCLQFGRKWGTECLNTRFPLLTLLCAGYSVKLINCNILVYSWLRSLWYSGTAIFVHMMVVGRFLLGEINYFLILILATEQSLALGCVTQHNLKN